MTKIYRTIDNNYVALVAHDNDLVDSNYYYFGAFEYSIGQNVDSGEWELYIYDLSGEEILGVDDLSGIDHEVVTDLVLASRGEVEYEEIGQSDYYERTAMFVDVLADEVLAKAIAAESSERV